MKNKHILSLPAKKTTALLLLLFFAIIGSGCQKQDDERTVIRFWHGIESPENNRLLQKKVDTFEKRNPDIRIELQNIGAQDRAMPRIMTAMSADRQPELLWFAPVYTGRIAASGKLRPAETFFKSDESFSPGDIYEGLLDSGKYNGKIYTVPFETNCLAVYYNKDHFASAGIEQYPKTWEELRSAAEKLSLQSDKDKEPERYGMLIPLGTQEWTVWSWQTFLWQAGGQILDESEKKPRFHLEEGIQALNFWIDMVHKDNSAVLSEPNAGYKIEPFLAEEVSMMINGPWNYPLLKDQEELNYGSFPLPKNKKQATNIGGENVFIFKSSPEKEAASWKFAKFIMSEEFQVEWAIQTGYLPVNKTAAESQRYEEFLDENPFIRTFVESMEFGKSRPAVEEYSRLSDRMGRALEKALHLREPPSEALKKAAEEAEDFL
ncbi:MAG: ABC transporter substrate-binding protein [Elusimicrobiota bacterium]